MCLLVTMSSSLQAHHTVWRKLRQRAEKPVRITNISIPDHAHSSRSSDIKAAALRPAQGRRAVLGQWSGRDAGSKWLLGPHSASSLPGCSHHFRFHKAARGWDLTQLFLLLCIHILARPERAAAFRKKAGLIVLMKDKLLFSELDIKDTDINSRSKERSIFKSLQVQGSCCRRPSCTDWCSRICSVWA